MTLLQKPPAIPKKSGVYIFRNRQKKALYIGKAADLKNRLSSYFQKNISDRVYRLREEAKSVVWRELPTEFDALVQEALLIKKYHPKFNILMRDDKSYFYVIFTKEIFPRIIITHAPAVFKSSITLGPFTEGRPIFAILKLLRKSFPYCTCKKSHKRQCLNATIGRCLGFCCTINTLDANKENEKQYNKSIYAIKKIFSGRARLFLKSLEKELKRLSEKREFEKAALVRDQLFDLQSVMAHRNIIEDKNPLLLIHAKTALYLQTLFKRKNPVSRIEGYDISNISGTEATASCVVFEDGKPKKDDYKRFKIHYHGISDFDMLHEVLERRLKHTEWHLPDCVLIDGGAPQLRVAAKIFSKYFKTKNSALWPCAVVGLSKAKNAAGRILRKSSGDEILTILGGKRLYVKDLPPSAMHILQAIRDEAHRFAKRYHHILRKRKFQNNNS